MRDEVALARTVPVASVTPLGTVFGSTWVNAQRMKLSTFVTFKPPQHTAPPDRGVLIHFRLRMLTRSARQSCSAP